MRKEENEEALDLMYCSYDVVDLPNPWKASRWAIVDNLSLNNHTSCPHHSTPYWFFLGLLRMV